MNSRLKSFIAVTLVYVLSICVGVVAYAILPFDFWLSLLIADFLATVVVFIFSVILKNASVYDPYWSVQPIVILIGFGVKYGFNALGILVFIAVCIWGVRLTANWAYTFKDLTHQDWRYTMLKEKTGKLYPLVNFLGIHMFPTIVVYACTLPAVFAIYYGVSFSWLSVIFITVSLAAVVLQGTADYQMHSFRKNRTTLFIRNGLWKHSRHPNYLGEILMWWGIALAVFVSNTNFWYLLFGALINNLMFIFISIPLADGRQSKKKDLKNIKPKQECCFP